MRVTGGPLAENPRKRSLDGGDPADSLEAKSVLEIIECPPYEYLKVSEAFVRALINDDRPFTPYYGYSSISTTGVMPYLGLPKLVRKHLRWQEDLILELPLWSTDSGGLNAIADTFRKLTMRAGSPDVECKWPPAILQSILPQEYHDEITNYKPKDFTSTLPDALDIFPDYAYVTYILRRLLAIASRSIALMCARLSIPSQYPVATQIWVAFRYLLRNCYHLLFDRHIDHLILCTIYGVCKALKYTPELSFSIIADEYTCLRKKELGERTCTRVIRRVSLHRWKRFHNRGENKEAKKGNIIQFYNQVYVSEMKNYLLRSKSLHATSLELKKFLEKSETAIQPKISAPPKRCRHSNISVKFGIAESTLQASKMRVSHTYGDPSDKVSCIIP